MLRKLMTLTLAGASLALLALAQEGHPITGSWHGEWGPNKATRNHLVFNMRWENKAIVGTINPGRNSFPIKTATLNAETWMVHIEADTKDGQKVVADGKMADIGSYNRTITGTWQQGTVKGDFKLTRD